MLFHMTFMEKFSSSNKSFCIPIYKLHIRLLAGLKIKWYSNKQYVSKGDEIITKGILCFLYFRTPAVLLCM